MRKYFYNYLAAAGSVMDIMPSTDYREFTSSSDYHAITGDVAIISNDMNMVIRNEFKTQKCGSKKVASKTRATRTRC